MSTPTSHSGSWTAHVREAAVEALPPERLLPDSQPTYVASWIYVFGVASIASLIVIVTSGCILTLKGPA
jgi:ubiquinol-cytochrome c reductase cytochrome b subunit